MARIIGIVSGKGGVGKTVVSANLGIALTSFDVNTIILDANITTSHLGLQLGMYHFPITFNAVISGNASIEEAIYRHPSGVRVVPASLSLSDIVDLEPRNVKNVIESLNEKADIVLIDSAPGLGREALIVIKACDELLIVANPEITSIIDVIKIAEVAKRLEKKVLGIVLNRVKYLPYELTAKEIEKKTSLPIIASIPEDPLISKSILLREPAITLDEESLSSIEFKKLAARVIGKRYRPKILRKSLVHEFSRGMRRFWLNGLTIFRRV